MKKTNKKKLIDKETYNNLCLHFYETILRNQIEFDF